MMGDFRGCRVFCLLVLVTAFMFFLLAPAWAEKASGPLRVHSSNPRYFDDGSGKAIYLTGSHTWTNLVDDDTSYPPKAFDYGSYLDFMEEHNHNFMRMWTWEQSKYTYGDGFQYSAPQPWSRTGPGNALDGRPKFDLTRFNEEYFSRLRSRVIAAGRRGIYVSIMLFEGHGAQRSKVPWCWDGHPLNAENNINGIDGNPDGDDRGLEIYTLEIPEITRIQEAYVRKVIDTVNDLDNVLYEIINEAGPYSTQWQYHMINYIKSYESTKPKQHPVGMTFQFKGGTNTALFSSPADWISPNQEGGYRDNPPAADGSKVIISDTDHLWGIGGNQQWVWKSFLRGLNPIYMDPYGDPPGDESIRKNMGYTLDYAERMNLASMTPMNKLSSTKYCLANPGSEYLIYQPDSGSFTVKLNAGTYSYEWFNPSSGDVTETGSLTSGGGSESFNPPFGGDAVLYLSSAEETEGACSDTDRGRDYHVKGTVTDKDGVEHTDHCIDEQNLREYYCNEDGTSGHIDHECPDVCTNGACANADDDVTLTLRFQPSGTGCSVTIKPPDETYDREATITFTKGMKVSLTANDILGHIFHHWEGDIHNTDATVTITMDTDKTVIACFREATTPSSPSLLSDICPAPPNDYLMRMVCLVVPILCVIMNVLVPVMFILIALGGLMQLSTDDGIRNQGKHVILNTILGVVIISAFIGLSDLLIGEVNVMEVCLLGEAPEPPHLTASIDANPTSGVVPPDLVVSLTGSASGGTEPYTYSWDCGGGTLEVTGSNTATCTYTSEGTYTVTLTVTDTGGETDRATETITVGVVGACEEPSCDEIYGYIRTAIEGTSVDEDLVKAVIKKESDYHQCCFGIYIDDTCKEGEVLKSSAGALGLMQLMPGTASELGVDPLDPQQNVEGGVRYLNTQLNEFGSVELALAAYNMGPGYVACSLGYNWPVCAQYSGYDLCGEGVCKTPAERTWDCLSTCSIPAETLGYVNGIMGVIGTSAADCSDLPALTASFTANPTSGVVPPDLVVSLTGSASGGTEPYTYSWDCGGGTLEVTGSNTATCTYTSEGTYTVTLTVTDSKGETDRATETIVVSSLSVSIESPPDGASFAEGDTILFRGEVYGGTLPYTLEWSSNMDGVLGSLSKFYWDGLSQGTHTITLTVTDGSSHQKTGVATVDITITEPECRAVTENGEHEDKIDVVFVRAFDAQSDALPDNFEDIIDDAKIDFIHTVPIAENTDKLNFYYYTKKGSVYADSNDLCAGSSPPGYVTYCSFADTTAYLHKGTCRDCSHTSPTLDPPIPGSSFTVTHNYYMHKTFTHEAGHAIFNLRDEYYGLLPTYKELSPNPNIWSSQANCEVDRTAEGWTEACDQICDATETNCVDYWRLDYDCIMRHSMNVNFCPACVRRMNWVFTLFN